MSSPDSADLVASVENARYEAVIDFGHGIRSPAPRLSALPEYRSARGFLPLGPAPRRHCLPIRCAASFAKRTRVGVVHSALRIVDQDFPEATSDNATSAGRRSPTPALVRREWMRSQADWAPNRRHSDGGDPPGLWSAVPSYAGRSSASLGALATRLRLQSTNLLMVRLRKSAL